MFLYTVTTGYGDTEDIHGNFTSRKLAQNYIDKIGRNPVDNFNPIQVSILDPEILEGNVFWVEFNLIGPLTPCSCKPSRGEGKYNKVFGFWYVKYSEDNQILIIQLHDEFGKGYERACKIYKYIMENNLWGDDTVIDYINELNL